MARPEWRFRHFPAPAPPSPALKLSWLPSNMMTAVIENTTGQIITGTRLDYEGVQALGHGCSEGVLSSRGFPRGITGTAVATPDLTPARPLGPLENQEEWATYGQWIRPKIHIGIETCPPFYDSETSHQIGSNLQVSASGNSPLNTARQNQEQYHYPGSKEPGGDQPYEPISYPRSKPKPYRDALFKAGPGSDPSRPYACSLCRERFNKTDHLRRHHEMKHNPDFVFEHVCEICKAEGKHKAFPWGYELKRHIKSHTGSTVPLVVGEVVTFKHRTYEMHLARSRYQEEPGKEEEYQQIRLLALSFPGLVRHYGGALHGGPLAGTTSAGRPDVFNTQGKLRDKYHFLTRSIKALGNKRKIEIRGDLDEIAALAAPKRQRPSRGCSKKLKATAKLPEPHRGLFRFRGDIDKKKYEGWVPSVTLPPKFFEDKSFVELEDSLYNESDFKAAYPKRPRYWPKGWQWPQNPTWIPEDESQCDLCSDRTCSCIQKVLIHPTPQIVDFGAKGEGLKAHIPAKKKVRKNNSDLETKRRSQRQPKPQSKPGDEPPVPDGRRKVYSKGDFLGQMTGRLIPVDSLSSHGYIIGLTRGDLPGTPTLAWIDCLEYGNWVRKANHICQDAACAFQNMRISNKFRIMLITLRDIYEGEEITVSYGAGYWDGRICLCGTDDCVSKGKVVEVVEVVDEMIEDPEGTEGE